MIINSKNAAFNIQQNLLNNFGLEMMVQVSKLTVLDPAKIKEEMKFKTDAQVVYSELNGSLKGCGYFITDRKGTSFLRKETELDDFEEKYAELAKIIIESVVREFSDCLVLPGESTQVPVDEFLNYCCMIYHTERKLFCLKVEFNNLTEPKFMVAFILPGIN